jgi:hypothetical protein
MKSRSAGYYQYLNLITGSRTIVQADRIGRAKRQAVGILKASCENELSFLGSSRKEPEEAKKERRERHNRESQSNIRIW